MAINTAAKRKAVSGIITALTIVGVTVDSTPGVEWRQSVGWGYLGIEAADGGLFRQSPAPVSAGFQRNPSPVSAGFQQNPPVPEVAL